MARRRTLFAALAGVLATPKVAAPDARTWAGRHMHVEVGLHASVGSDMAARRAAALADLSLKLGPPAGELLPVWPHQTQVLEVQRIGGADIVAAVRCKAPVALHRRDPVDT